MTNVSSVFSTSCRTKVDNDIELRRNYGHLVDREGGVVGFDHGVGHFGARDDAVRVHDAVGKLFPDLGNQEGAHP